MTEREQKRLKRKLDRYLRNDNVKSRRFFKRNPDLYIFALLLK